MWVQWFRLTGLQSAGSVVVVHGLTCSAARGNLPDQGLNLCLLHWQADSLPLSHQGTLPMSVSFKEVQIADKGWRFTQGGVD